MIVVIIVVVVIVVIYFISSNERVEKLSIDDYKKEQESITPSSDSIQKKKREKDREESLKRLADSNNCGVSEAKESYIKGLVDIDLSSINEDDVIETIRCKKYEEAQIFNIHPDDTASDFMMKWTLDFFQKEQLKKATLQYELLNDDELNSLVQGGDKVKIKDYLSRHPEKTDAIFEKILKIENPEIFENEYTDI